MIDIFYIERLYIRYVMLYGTPKDFMAWLKRATKRTRIRLVKKQGKLYIV